MRAASFFFLLVKNPNMTVLATRLIDEKKAKKKGAVMGKNDLFDNSQHLSSFAKKAQLAQIRIK